MNLINGKLIANEILDKLKQKIENFDPKPKLGIIQVGDNQASEIYVNKKINDAKKIGMETEKFYLEQSSIAELMEITSKLNNRSDIDGYILQLPVPVEGTGNDIKQILNNICIEKDIDGLNVASLGSIWQGGTKSGFIPATVLGIIECLKYVSIYPDKKYTVDECDQTVANAKFSEFIKGKNIVIVNHSLIIGKPLAGILVNLNATVSVCHEFTSNLQDYTKNADIVITGAGVPKLITEAMVKDGVILIDAGIKRDGSKVAGDVDFDCVKDKCSWITPVPNGVGPLTRAMLLQNVYDAYMRRVSKDSNSI